MGDLINEEKGEILINTRCGCRISKYQIQLLGSATMNQCPVITIGLHSMNKRFQ